MKGLHLPSKITRSFNLTKLKVVDKAPEIYVFVGDVALVGAIISAIRGTFKFVEHLKTYESNLEKIQRIEDAQKAGHGDEELRSIDIKAARREARIELFKGGVKSYALTALFGFGSAASNAAALGLMKGKYLTTASVLATTVADKTFLEDAVREKYGEDELRALQTECPDPKEITAHVDEKTGEVVEESKGSTYHSIFAKFFDEANPNWVKSAEENRNFLYKAEEMANYLLEGRGYFYLNDVYAILGIPKTKAGELYGWVWDPNKVHQISFGIFREDSRAAREFVNGFERSILLEFNCDKEPIVGRLPMADK